MFQSQSNKPHSPPPQLAEIQTQLNSALSTKSNPNTIVGDSQDESHKGARYYAVLVFMLIIVIGGSLAYIFGEFNKISTLLTSNKSNPVSNTIKIIDSNNGSIVLLQHNEAGYSIYVRKSGQAGWSNLTISDRTAKMPSLSLSGNRVAYISEIDQPHIVIAHSNSDQAMRITAEQISNDVREKVNIDLGKLNVCIRTSPSISPNDSLLAFFLCRENHSEALLVVADIISYPPKIIWIYPSSYKNNISKNIAWLNDLELVLVLNNEKSRENVVEIIEVTK